MIVAKSNEELKYLISEVKKGKLKLDEIDVSEIQDFSEVFEYFTFDPEYGSIENWDVSNGINFKAMFRGAKKTSFLNLSKWQLSKAENCDYMFTDCMDFVGGDLSNWNPVNLKSAESMFGGCIDFKGIGLDKWYLPNLESGISMFAGCENFDQDLSNWDCRNLRDLRGMFRSCTKFRGIGLDKWNITLISDGTTDEAVALISTFAGCVNFDANLSSWKVEGSFYLDSTFEECKNFKGKGLEKWKITILGTEENHFLEYTFYECSKLDFNKSPDWKFQVSSKNSVYYSSFSKAFSLTAIKFLDHNIPIYDLEQIGYYKGKKFYKYKKAYGFYSIEDLPDNMSFSITAQENNEKLMNPELSLPNLKKPIIVSIKTYEPFTAIIQDSTISTPLKLSSKRIRLKRADKNFLEIFKKEYGYSKDSIPLNVKYGSGPFGYLLAKKTEVILPHTPYYKLIQKIPVYTENKIQAPNTVLAETQTKSAKLFFNTKNIFFNKDYIKCF